jgi:SAM-dependent MidA family methyltransferase
MQRFSDYMQSWLYGPQGYYTQAPVIGQRGDFVTSVAVSPFFGGTIANYLVRRIFSGHIDRHCMVCEIGAHRGHLLADMVQFIYTLDPLLLKTMEFVIIEPIERLRKEQRAYFERAFGDALSLHQVADLRDINTTKEAFVIANELFDAFSVDLIYDDQWAVVDDHIIGWEKAPEDVVQKARSLGIQKGELAVGFEPFAAALGRAFKKCEVVTFDYGQECARNDFSARIYQAQKVWPLFEPESLAPFYAQADLTADVHFGHLKSAFEAAGFEAGAIRAQNVALLDMGLDSLLETLQQKAGYEAYRREVGRVRALLDPAMLGERFKMAGFIKAG